MRILPLMAAMLISVTAIPAMATTVAVIDIDAAVMATDFAKKTVEKLNDDTKPQRDRSSTLNADLAALREKFQKNGSIMSDKEKQEMEKQYQVKAYELNGIAEGFQKRSAEVTQGMMQTIAPTLRNVVDEVRKAGKYEIILDRKSTHMVDPAVDITREVSEKLNTALNAAPPSSDAAAKPAPVPAAKATGKKGGK